MGIGMRFLLGAIALEIMGTSLLKTSEGFTRVTPTVFCLLAYAASFTLFARAVLVLPVGLAYALWSGIGTLSIVAIGLAFLGERITSLQGFGVALVISGVVVINITGATAT